MATHRQLHTDNILEHHRTLGQLASYLSVHEGTVRRWRVRREGPPAVKIAGRLYFPCDLTARWLRSRVEGEVSA
jgi:hypothetical protein